MGLFFFSWFRNQSKTTPWSCGVGSGIEHLLNTCEALGSISCPTRKIKSHTLHLAVTLQPLSNWEQLLIASFLWSLESPLKNWDLSVPWGQKTCSNPIRISFGGFCLLSTNRGRSCPLFPVFKNVPSSVKDACFCQAFALYPLRSPSAFLGLFSLLVAS